MFNSYEEEYSGIPRQNCYFYGNHFYGWKSRSEENLYVSSSFNQFGLPPSQYFHNESQGLMQVNNSSIDLPLEPSSPYYLDIPLTPLIPAPSNVNQGIFFSNGNMGPIVPDLRRQNHCYYMRRTISKSRNEISTVLNVQSKRRWENVKAITSSDKPHFDFSLMSYNMLAQKLLEDHEYLYKKHNRNCKKWETRWLNLFNEIKTLNPDILCLQEVQQSHLNTHYRKMGEIGYKELYKKRTGVRCDGCAVYYRANKLTLLEYETVEFYQPNISVLDRDNIAIIAKFCPKDNPNKPFIVVTTHLLYNPKRQDVRLAQMQLLLAEVERLSFRWNSKGKERYWPIILTGDFNSTPDSAVYEFITKGILKFDHLEARKLQKVQSPAHGKVLVPTDLQITDECQHERLIEKRATKKDISRLEEYALISIRNTDKKLPQGSDSVIPKEVKNIAKFCSGTLKHPFAFKSVYNHGSSENPEGTTFQNEWVTVDYIFYSGKKQENVIEDHKLILLSRYRLPLRSELGNMKIPNSLMGSDHLCLVGKFRLRL
ncbi:protein angel isoform X2 [Anthonomus grandis grandis]|nr:protein angel isoform X2 [Anthonomus grandis grandis]